MKIISGGQTGVDQAALRAAKEVGWETGGWMPKGFMTEAGPCPEFRELYGMTEARSKDPASRTGKNVAEANVTLIMGDLNTRGARVAKNCCGAQGKPFRLVPRDMENAAEWAYEVIFPHRPHVLNVAGNREETHPGVHEWAYKVLTEAFRRLKEHGL